MEKIGKLYSTTSYPARQDRSFIVWDRRGHAKRSEHFALYTDGGELVGYFASALRAEQEAGLLLDSLTASK